MLENGDDTQKKEAKKYLEGRKKAVDKEASKIIDDYEKKYPETKETK